MHVPPRRKKGQGTGRRKLAGEMLDFCAVSEAFGGTEKTWRGWADSGIVPYHRIGIRIFFLRSELAEFLKGLPGNSPQEARENLLKRDEAER